MKEKTDEELKQIFNLTDKEIEELRVVDKYETEFIGGEYDLFKHISESIHSRIKSPSFDFYYLNGVRVKKEEWQNFVENQS